MKHSARVRMVYGPCQGFDEPSRFIHPPDKIGDSGRETASLQKSHRQILLLRVLADLKDGNDVGVLKACGGIGLHAQPPPLRFRSEVPAVNQLERYHSIWFRLPRPVDHAHPSASNLFNQHVAAERAWLRLRCLSGPHGLPCPR